MRPPLTLLPALLVPSLLTTRPVSATVEACPALRVEADSAFRVRYPHVAEQLSRELQSRAELDGCAAVELRLAGADNVTVIVTLPDGRAATRSGIPAEDISPTLQALLLLPERPPVVAPVRAAPPPRRPAPTTPPATARDTLPPPTVPRSVGFELSVVSGARIGDGQLGYGAGVLSFLEVQNWLLGFQGRADGYRALRGSDPQTALELGLLAGRRIGLGNVTLDLTAGPALAIQGVALSRTESVQVDSSGASPAPPPPMPASEPQTGVAPRLLLGARLGFAPRSVLRSFVGLDGELGPRGDASQDQSAGRLPAFSIGLSLGATVGTP